VKLTISLLVLTSLVLAQGRGDREQNKALAGLIVHEIKDSVVISKVLKGSPAAKAGLRAGDILLQAGERKIQRHNDVDRAISGLAAGDKLKVVYERESRKTTVELKLVAHRGFKSDYLKGPGKKRTGFKAPAWSAFAWVNVPRGKLRPTVINSRGKVVVFHCFQSW